MNRKKTFLALVALVWMPLLVGAAHSESNQNLEEFLELPQEVQGHISAYLLGGEVKRDLFEKHHYHFYLNQAVWLYVTYHEIINDNKNKKDKEKQSSKLSEKKRYQIIRKLEIEQSIKDKYPEILERLYILRLRRPYHFNLEEVLWIYNAHHAIITGNSEEKRYQMMRKLEKSIQYKYPEILYGLQVVRSQQALTNLLPMSEDIDQQESTNLLPTSEDID